MGALDLKDLHLSGDLDVDLDIDPMPLPEMSLAEAEDLYLAVCCSTPKFADHSRVQDAHLRRRLGGHRQREHQDPSPRARWGGGDQRQGARRREVAGLCRNPGH